MFLFLETNFLSIINTKSVRTGCETLELKFMFTQMRTNLKFIGAILFTIFFFVGGFFINTIKGEAASTVKSFNVFYSLSSPVNNTNKDGSISTIVLVGCAPKSGDLYDVNTGKHCNNNTKTVLIGCKVGSGDVFDVNTGIRCSSYIKPMLFGCAFKSVDTYDINTGKHCGATLITLPKTNTIIKTTPGYTNETTVTNRIQEISPIANNIKEVLPTDENQNGLSGREKLKNSLTASVAKVGTIVSGPMSIWIILLIILILLGGSYGIYSLLKKNENTTVPVNTPVSKATTPAEKIIEKKIEQAKVMQESQPVKPAPETTASVTNATLPNLNIPQ